jgi:hypothetical protein
VINRIIETGKMSAIGVWNSPPIELLTAAVVVPVTIVGSFWILQWVRPAMIVLGVVAGVVFGVTAIVKIIYLWSCDRRYFGAVRRDLKQ